VASRAHLTIAGGASGASGERRHVEIFRRHSEMRVASEPFGRVRQVETVGSGVGNRRQRHVGAGDGDDTSGTSGCRRLQHSLSPGCVEVCKDVAPVAPDDGVGRDKDAAVVAVEVAVGM